jgi:hypothetical protein
MLISMRRRKTNAAVRTWTLPLALALLCLWGDGASSAPNCKKGQPCGNSCISWDKVCRKPSPSYAPPQSKPAQRPGDVPATVSCPPGRWLVPGSNPPICR